MAASSCTHDMVDPCISNGSYVYAYYIGDLEANFVHMETDYIGLPSSYFIDVNIKRDGIHRVYQDSHGQDSVVFHNLSVKNNDVSYPYKYTNKIPNQYFYQNFTSLEIVSDQDYDESHRAGESLLDIAYYLAVSCNEYVKNGYPYDRSWAPRNAWRMRADSVSADNMKMLFYTTRYIMEIHFPTPPTLSKVHNFTITLVADDGTKYVLPVAATFDEEQ